MAVSDAAGGEVGRVQYDPYGEVLTSTLPVTLTDRLFTGQRLDSSTGLYYYNARYYDPHPSASLRAGLGRFIQPDTLVPDPLNPQAWNRFSYVYNNPTSYVDPNGQFAVPAILLVAAVGFLVGEIYAGTQGYTPLDVEFWYYSGGGAVAATSLYFLAADVAIVAGLGLQQAGLWTGSTAVFEWGLTATSAGAGMYAWAFQPLDFSRWRARYSLQQQILDIMDKPYLSEADIVRLEELMVTDIEAEGGVILKGSPINIVQNAGEPNWVRYTHRHELFHEWIHFNLDRQAGWPGWAERTEIYYASQQVKAYGWQLAHPEILEAEGWGLPGNIIALWQAEVAHWQRILGSD